MRTGKHTARGTTAWYRTIGMVSKTGLYGYSARLNRASARVLEHFYNCAARRPVHVYCTTCAAPGQGGHLSGSENCTYAGNQVGTACALRKAWPLAAVALMRAEGASARSALTNAVAAAELLGGTGKLPGRPRQGGVSYVPLRIAANLPGTYVHVRTCTHAHARTCTHVHACAFIRARTRARSGNAGV